MNGVTAELVRQLFNYDPATGILSWRVARGGRVAGMPAGHTRGDGYRVVGLNGRDVYAHRLIWLHVTGAWPAQHIDHRDADKGNNRWGNLREASRTLNMLNLKGPKSNNRLGVLGVDALGPARFRARLKVSGKVRQVGIFATPEAASAAYHRAKAALEVA